MATGVEEHEAARAVGVLGFARREAGLAEEGRLLVAQVAGDGHPGERPRLPAVRRPRSRMRSGQQERRRNPEGRQHLRVPVEGLPGPSASSGWHWSRRSRGRRPAGRRSGSRSARCRSSRRAGRRTRPAPGNPRRDRGSSGPWVPRSRSPGAGRSWPGSGPARPGPASSATIAAVRVSCQTTALWIGRPVARSQIDRRLALVGDPDGGELRGRDAGLGQGGQDHLVGALEDLQRIVLHPAGLGIDLAMLALVDRDRAAGLVEDDETGAARALVERADVVAHSRHCP